MTEDTSLLQAALIGYQAQAEKLAVAIADVEKRLGKRSSGKVSGSSLTGTRKRRTMSPEGRARIAAAQRKRWAAARRKNAKTMTAGG
jgi:hypothetical protein